MLQTRPQISLGELLQARPLAQGLGELVTYLQIAGEANNSVVDEETLETVEWQVPDTDNGAAGSEPPEITRRARLPRVIFVRDAG